MTTINFRHFKIFSGISHEKSFVADVSTTLADHIYMTANGIMAHDLSFRIYRSEGPIELSAEELSFLKEFVKKHSTPVFQDSFYANLTD